MGDDAPGEERFNRLWHEHAAAVLAYARRRVDETQADGLRQVVDFEPFPGTYASTEVYGDQDAVRTVLAGLREVPADDPRLDEYAMPE